MSIVSDGEYGIPRGLMFGMPTICSEGRYRVVPDLEIDAFARARIDASVAELMDEMQAVRAILAP
jgi:malate dehydrogenase